MAEWKKIRIEKFLTERPGRYKPDDDALSGFRRLEKIDFNGNIHFSDKSSKTDMIIISPGDLVISGINVSKGALAMHQGSEPVAATIHYSSYSFDKTIIEIEFLKRFLKSPRFRQILKDQVKGGIKTEIKANHLLPLEITLPELEDQKKVVDYFHRTETEISDLGEEIGNQCSILKRTRQTILQDAVEGKLTTAWRKAHPEMICGDNHAARLMEKIKAGKEILVKEGKIKKEKPLPPVSDDEKPYELPEGWIWCRLGEVGLFARGKSKHRPRNDDKLFTDGKYPFVQTGDVAQSKKNNYAIRSYKKMYNDRGLSQSKLWPKGTLCITIAANIAETGFLDIDACFPDSVVGFTSLTGFSTSVFIRSYLAVVQSQILKFAPATAQKNINLDIIWTLPFPLPPLAEQQAIVEKVDRLMDILADLEKQVSTRKFQAEQLIQTVLREAFDRDN